MCNNHIGLHQFLNSAIFKRFETGLSLEDELPHSIQKCFRPAVLSLENEVSQLTANTHTTNKNKKSSHPITVLQHLAVYS